jgi:hypothetical protein
MCVSLSKTIVTTIFQKIPWNAMRMNTVTSCCLLTISHPKIEGKKNHAHDYFLEPLTVHDQEPVVNQRQ